MNVFVPYGNLNISRTKMPQIDSHLVQDFIKIVRQSGIDVKKERVRVDLLKPTQKEINTEKVEGMMDGMLQKNLAKPIIVSSDNYVLDGHHRWLALLNQDRTFKLTVFKFDLPITQLIEVAKKYSKVKFKKISEARSFASETLLSSRDLFATVKNAIEKKRKSKWDYELEYKDHDVDLVATIAMSKKQEAFVVDAAVSDSIDNQHEITIGIKVNPDYYPMAYNDLLADIKEMLAHEFEHIAQDMGMRKERYSSRSLKSLADYYLLPHEITANLAGLLRRAKTEKKSMDQVIDEFVKRLPSITSKEQKRIVKKFTELGKKTYPQAQWI